MGGRSAPAWREASTASKAFRRPFGQSDVRLLQSREKTRSAGREVVGCADSVEQVRLLCRMQCDWRAEAGGRHTINVPFVPPVFFTSFTPSITIVLSIALHMS